MKCSWCNRGFWPTSRPSATDIAGPMHRKCRRQRWDRFFADGEGPRRLRALDRQTLYEVLPAALVVWLAWHIDIKRDPGMMAYLEQLSRERRGNR